MTTDEFKKYKNELKKQGIFIPQKIFDYIEELESNNKKTVYTVNSICQHDMGVEQKRIYQGTDPDRAFKECYSEIKDLIEDDKCEYMYPLPDINDHFTSTDEYYETKYTGLQIKQMFIDWIKNSIKNKKPISFDFARDGDFDPDNEGDAAGFVLDIEDI